MEKLEARTASLSVLAFAVLLYLPSVAAQPGFLSIDCGGKTNYTDPENNITWTTDANYIQLGRTAEITTAPISQTYNYFPNSTLPSYLRTVRYFPKPLNKCCYQLSVNPNSTYLLRMWFLFGYYGGSHPPLISFSLETLGTVVLFNVSLGYPEEPAMKEIIFMAGWSDVLYICFVRLEEEYDPFVSSIELRQLSHGMYEDAKPGRVLVFAERYDLGAETKSFLRYPRDPFDRLWQSDYQLTDGSNYLKAVNTAEPISIQNAPDQPPTAVMRTALLLENANSFSLRLWNPKFGEDVVEAEHLIALYFAEIQTLKASESRNFYVAINKAVQYRSISVLNLTHGHRFSSTELKFAANEPATMSQINLTLEKTNYSTRGPMMNAFENYVIIPTQQDTAGADVGALSVVRKAFGLKEWISDPCFAVPWKGIECNLASSTFRVSQINLSGWNLNGSIPPSIGELTEVRNMYLDNNHLTGNLPDLSKLTKLEKLHLQNNNLSGYLPQWLSQLKNLKELYLAGNNLSGTIPPKLLSKNPPLQLWIHPGNPNLVCIGNHIICNSTSPPSNNGKVRVVVGLAIGAISIIALALAVIFTVYRKNFWTKEDAHKDKNRSNMGRDETRSLEQEDYSMVKVPNPTKTRAFTLDEMMTATQNFSQKIGQGGFGSVFYGKLQEGKDVAVKVLSLFSKQGVVEFLNEVDLLSRVNHKNLVPLLGYCNESRELMLIYEHMSGGSLKDHLYGPAAELSELHWKTRLKIALDAAQANSHLLIIFRLSKAFLGFYVCNFLISHLFLAAHYGSPVLRPTENIQYIFSTDSFPSAFFKGLEYLHVSCTPKIIHRDVKTANILLDSNLTAKLSDFGLSRMTIDEGASHITTTVKGTAGYLDPEYFSTHMLTEKSDVYSFGVVLLEIICGRQPINVQLSEEQLNLIRWVTPYVEAEEDPGKLAEIVDKRLGSNYNVKSLSHVAKLSIRCVQAEPSSRPTISEIVAQIKEAIKLQPDIPPALVSEEIDLEFEDPQTSPVCTSLGSSVPKELGPTDSSSNIIEERR